MIAAYVAGLLTLPVLAGVGLLVADMFSKNLGSWCGGPCGRRFGRVGRNFKVTTRFRVIVHTALYYRGKQRWLCKAPVGATGYDVDRWNVDD